MKISIPSIPFSPSVWSWQTDKTCTLPCQGLFNDIKSKGVGGEGEPRVWEGYDMVTSKQTNKHLSSYIVLHILKLWIPMDYCLYFISSLTHSLLEFQTLGPSLPHTTPPYLGLHQGLPRTTYRVNYFPIPTHKHEQVDYTTYRVNYSPIPTTHKHEQVDYTTCRVNYSPIPTTHKHEQVDYTTRRVNYSPIPTTHKHEQVDYTRCRVNYSDPQTWTSRLYEARYYFNDTTQNCWPIKNNYLLLLTHLESTKSWAYFTGLKLSFTLLDSCTSSKT